MKITFIGTSSGLSVLHRSHASILFEGSETGLLVDCGEGTTHSLLRQNIDFNRLDKIIVSHTHPDHCAGIPLLIQYMHLIERTKPIEIYLPQGMKEVFQRFLHQLYMISETHPFDYSILEYGESRDISSNEFIVSPIPNRHLEGKEEIALKYNISIATFSLIIGDGNSKVYYSADLKDINDFNPPPDVEILIVECTHIGIEEAVSLANKKGIRRMIFTHVPPKLDNIELPQISGMQIDIAHDGMVINTV